MSICSLPCCRVVMCVSIELWENGCSRNWQKTTLNKTYVWCIHYGSGHGRYGWCPVTSVMGKIISDGPV